MTAWHVPLCSLLTDATRVAALDPAAAGWLAAHAPKASVVAADAPADPPCELAFGLDLLAGLDATQARAALFHARTFVAPVVLVVADAACALSAGDFRALAFEPLAGDAAATLYQFNLATYKIVPDWLNPRFWANPERWQT